jgi:hypothetical protein
LYYYSGSVLPIEWTNQHGCGGNSKVQCEIVIQYACEDTLDPQVDNFWPWASGKSGSGSDYFGKQHFRDVDGYNIAAPRDGVPINDLDAATDTIPDNIASAIPNTEATRRFGMQENYDYYQLCQHTERNKGLYTADQNVRRNDQRGTRQNPNGNRNGLECPEERDHYPWWQPSPWKDIAILTDSASNDICYPTSEICTERCKYYMDNTMNFHTKGYCDANHNTGNLNDKLNNIAWTQRRWYNNRDACENNGFTWYDISHADNFLYEGKENSTFVCAHTQFARTNQLGNSGNGDIVSQTEAQSAGIVESSVVEGVNANRFLWTVPEIPVPKEESSYFAASMKNAYHSCVVRIRYNLSSSDLQQWPEDAVKEGTEGMVNSTYNKGQPNGIPLEQDPYFYIGSPNGEFYNEMFVSTAINTNQYSRTFQDRSYVFAIKPLPTADSAVNDYSDTPEVDYTEMKRVLNNGGKIYNVNVRGKRGNIVQTFPAVEYDFVPNALALSTNDMVHFQWTGSDYNPRRGCNDGDGGPPDLNTFSTAANADINPRADRSNILFMAHAGTNIPMDYLGKDYNNENFTFAEKMQYSRNQTLKNSPCYDPLTDNEDTANQCYETMMRLAYLNQQKDRYSLLLRINKKCLTLDELLAIQNENVRNFHPLNCAKMNAKPFPYFDGGIMFMKKWGWFNFFSSRNNNLSNRQHIGVICVGDNCKVVNGTGVLQSPSETQADGATPVNTQPTPSPTMQPSIMPTTAPVEGESGIKLLADETFAPQNADLDTVGDGNPEGCAVFEESSNSSFVDDVIESQIGIAIGLLILGMVVAWAAVYSYNRWQARRNASNKFRTKTDWQNGENFVASNIRPSSVRVPKKPEKNVQMSDIDDAPEKIRPSSIIRSASVKADNLQMASPTKPVKGKKPKVMISAEQAMKEKKPPPPPRR